MNHIGVSPLTGRIYSGRVNKAGNAFHGGTFDVEGGGRKFVVTVTEAAAKPADPADPAEEQAS